MDQGQFQTLAPHNSRHPPQAETSVAAGSKTMQCEDVLGCLMSLFFGFLHSGEIVSPSEKNFDSLAHLCFSDVRVDSHSSPSYLQITIKASKTDPFCQGVTLLIGVLGGTLCPVSAVLNYMVARRSSPGPLFTWDDGRYLTRAGIVARVRSALSAAGYRGKGYAGHSFQIGAATTASRCGIQDSLIKTLGR